MKGRDLLRFALALLAVTGADIVFALLFGWSRSAHTDSLVLAAMITVIGAVRETRGAA